MPNARRRRITGPTSLPPVARATAEVQIANSVMKGDVRSARTIPPRGRAAHEREGTRNPRKSGGAERRSTVACAQPRLCLHCPEQSGRHPMSPDRPRSRGWNGCPYRNAGDDYPTVRHGQRNSPAPRAPTPYIPRRFRVQGRQLCCVKSVGSWPDSSHLAYLLRCFTEAVYRRMLTPATNSPGRSVIAYTVR